MDDQELRKFALDIASTSLRGAPFPEIVKGAEAFYEFLAGETVMRKSEALAYVKEVVSDLPPPIPTQETPPLGQADQTPSWTNFATARGPSYVSVGGDPNIYEIDDEAKTRIVNRVHTDDGSPVV